MFSIAAINDTSSARPRLETLQPTKEAQEARLAQIYQEALTELQAGNLLQAQVLLQQILEDPIIIQAKTSKKDGVCESIDSNPMLQLRFSTLKNLAETLYKQDSKYHNDALDCYLQAAAIDQDDVVLWNRLGTLACALGHLHIARAAFEQGLLCSPRNWLCMEKLAEVLIAVGDEEACHYIVKRLLKISPLHARASHINDVLEGRADSHKILEKREYFNECLYKLNVLPRGLDLLEPQHSSLYFSRKRLLEDEDEDHRNSKRQKCQTVEVRLPELSWRAMITSVLDQLDDSVGRKETKISAPLPQENLNSGKSVRPVDARPQVSSLVALVLNSKSSMQESVQQHTTLPLDKVQVLEHQKSCPLQLNGSLQDGETLKASSTAVAVVRNVIPSVSPTSISLEEDRKSKELGLEDVTISSDQGKQQITIDAGDPGKGVDALCEDELPSHERRITRLERVRTRRYEKDEEEFLDKDKDKDPAEIVKQLLEPFITKDTDDCLSDCKVNDDCSPGTGVELSRDGSADEGMILEHLNKQEEPVVVEEIDVQQFIEELKVDSGRYSVAHELLEKLSALPCNHKIPISKVLMLENLTRQLSWTSRSKQCSMFLAEICLDMCVSSSLGGSESHHFMDCDFHLCRVVEQAALHAEVIVSATSKESRSSTGSIASVPAGQERNLANTMTRRCDVDMRMTDEGSDSTKDLGLKAGQTDSHNAVSIAKVQRKIETLHKSKEKDWSLWVRYHWLNGLWLMLAGRQEEAHEELKLCLAILDKRAEVGENSVCVSLPHCTVESIISPVKVQRKMHELQIDKLLKRSGAQMAEKAQYSELIDLLVPVLLPNNQSDKVKLGFDEAKRGIVDSSPEYMGLTILISACEKVTPPNPSLALQCHAQKLEILCGAARNHNASERGCSLPSLEVNGSFSTSDSEQEEGRANEAESKLIAEEVKLISKCLSCVVAKLGDSGGLVAGPVQPSLLRKIQYLLLDLMCHYIRVHDIGRPVLSGLNIHFDSSSFVDVAISFCRLQHLDVNATLKQQVSLLATVHDVLAGQGLCCAKGCEGGEGGFLKLAIKHLGTVELRIRFTTGQQESSELVDSGANGEMMEISSEKDENQKSSAQLSDNKEDSREEPFSRKMSKGKLKKSVKSVKDDEAEEIEQRRVELGLDCVLDQCFFCLYGLNLRGGFETASQLDGLTEHKNTNLGDYKTKEHCAGVYQYVLPYAKACSRARLMKLKKVLRAIHKQFPNPPPDVLAKETVDPFLDDPEFDEERLGEMVLSGSSQCDIMDFALKGHASVIKQQEIQGFNQVEKGKSSQLGMSQRTVFENDGVKRTNSQPSTMNILPETSGFKNSLASKSEFYADHMEPYLEVYENLYHFVSEIEDMSVSDKWAGFVLTKEGEEFVEQNAKLLKYDLCFNPLRFESWYKLAKIYDEEVDLMLNDGSKNINSLDWRKNSQLTERVEMSRRRTRRCLLMTLALSTTPEKQSEMHELLALVYYDSLQNVAPSYDQRRHVPEKDSAWISLCQNALKHFEGAFMHKPDWTHLLYMGKLCEKLSRPTEEALDFYKRAADMKSSAVDPIYRLHASRLKLLCRSDEGDVKILQVLAQHCHAASTKERVCSLLDSVLENHVSMVPAEPVDKNQLLHEIRRQLFEDCVTVMKICVEGELKHYHKARFRLAHAFYSSTDCRDMDRAKEELAFCFRSSRSLFTINMWEIDGSLRKIRRKAAHCTNLDVQMQESSRKFITCVRKYLVLYLSLCEKTGDIYTLERAFTSLKTDKKFSLCLDDISRVALGKYIQALVLAICQADANDTISHSTLYSLLEKLFNLFMDYGTSWSESLQVSLAEAQVVPTTDVSEGLVYRYIHRYLTLLENEVKLDNMEAINERIRKRFKTFKLLGYQTSQICRHACHAWGRALCYALASVTPLPQIRRCPIEPLADFISGLVVDLQEDVFIKSSHEVPGTHDSIDDQLNAPSTERNGWADVRSDAAALISSITYILVRRASPDNVEKATALLRSTYVFYRDSLSGPFPGGINLFLVGAAATSEGMSIKILGQALPAEPLDISTPRKLLLWAFTLVHGRTGTVAEAVKYCEEQAKAKKGSSQWGTNTSPATVLNNTPG